MFDITGRRFAAILARWSVIITILTGVVMLIADKVGTNLVVQFECINFSYSRYWDILLSPIIVFMGGIFFYDWVKRNIGDEFDDWNQYLLATAAGVVLSIMTSLLLVLISFSLIYQPLSMLCPSFIILALIGNQNDRKLASFVFFGGILGGSLGVGIFFSYLLFPIVICGSILSGVSICWFATWLKRTIEILRFLKIKDLLLKKSAAKSWLAAEELKPLKGEKPE